jgi:hypothetical protein
MLPLWLIGAESGAEMVPCRVRGCHMIVNRLFIAAELRQTAWRNPSCPSASKPDPATPWRNL